MREAAWIAPAALGAASRRARQVREAAWIAPAALGAASRCTPQMREAAWIAPVALGAASRRARQVREAAWIAPVVSVVGRRAACAAARAVAALIAFVLVVAGVARAARADGLRPLDAPRVHAKPGGDAPPVPSEYREVDQDGIRFSYHPSTRDRIRPLFERAGAIRAELAKLTGAPVLRHVEVRVAAVPAEMVQLAPGDVPASAASVAFFEQRMVVMTVLSPSSSSPLDVEDALSHALAHLALDEATGGAGVPAWFHEGFAAHVAGPGFPGARALVGAALAGRFLSLDEVARAASYGDLAGSAQGDLAAAQAADFARFLEHEGDRSGAPALAGALRRVKDGDPFDRAVAASLDAPDAASVEARWAHDRARRYAFVPVLLALLSAFLVVTGVAMAARRSRRARTIAIAAVRARRASATPRAPAKVAAAARLAAGRGKDAAIHLPKDPEVPKVEHNGEWHTLH
jgi:hypothetical protein